MKSNIMLKIVIRKNIKDDNKYNVRNNIEDDNKMSKIMLRILAKE